MSKYPLQTQQQTSSDDIDEFDLPSSPIRGITEVKYDSTYGIALSYVFARDHFVAAAFNEGTFDGTLELGGEIERDDRIVAIKIVGTVTTDEMKKFIARIQAIHDRGEKALVYLTDWSRVVYVPTDGGYALLLSPTDPDGLLAALERRRRGR